MSLRAVASFSTAQQAAVRKIHSAMARADALNPITSAPWLPPASINPGPGNQVRANSTAYAANSVFQNAAGTHQFYVRITGTTAAAEPALVTNPIVTTVPYNMFDITDGGATLRWIGPVRTTVAQPGAPSVSQSTLPASLTVTNTFAPAVNGSPGFAKFIFSGTGAFYGNGVKTYIRGSSTTVGQRSAIFSGNYYLTSTAAALIGDAYVEFSTDAPLIAFDLTGLAGSGGTSGYPFDFIIDNRRLCDAPICGIANVAAGSGYLILDFRSAGGRRARRFKICSPIDGAFNAFFTTPADTVWIAPDSSRWTLACMGDSIMIGAGPGPELGGYGMAQVFGALVGASNTINLGVAGTGLIANNSGNDLTYIQRLQDLVSVNPDVIWILGDFNDSTQSVPTIQSAAVTYLQAIRAAVPNAMIIFSGSWGYGANPDTAIQAAVTQFNDPATFFVAVNTDTPAWRTGTGNISATTGSGNSDIYVAGDGTHPLQNGHFYMGHKLAAALKTLIASLVSLS